MLRLWLVAVAVVVAVVVGRQGQGQALPTRPDVPKAPGTSAEKDLSPAPVARTVLFLTVLRPSLTVLADTIRQGQTLRHVAHFVHWVVLEASEAPSAAINSTLARSGARFTHLHQPGDDCSLLNLGVQHAVQTARASGLDVGLFVVHLGDVAATYDLRAFHAMRDTVRVSTWPVGFVNGVRYEGPQCTHDARVKLRTPNHRDAFPLTTISFAFNLNAAPLDQWEAGTPPALGPTHCRDAYSVANAVLGAMLTSRDELETTCGRVLAWQMTSVAPNLKREGRLFHGDAPYKLEALATDVFPSFKAAMDWLREPPRHLRHH